MSLQIYFILLLLAFVNSTKPEGAIWEVTKTADDYLDDRPFLARESLLETHTIVGNSNSKPKKEKRESKYHVLISPGLKSYFDFHNPGEDTYHETHMPSRHHLKKRSIETMDDSPKNDIETKSNLNSSQTENYTNLSQPKQSAREARGATKEQWIQQAYPVDFHAPKENNEQRSSTNNDEPNVRAPRVHFVTQKRLDASETQDRAQVATRISPVEASRTARPYNDQPHRARSLENYDYRSRAYDSPNRVRDYRDYNLQRDYSRYDDRYNPVPTTEYDPGYSRTQKKQQRIIYYATLPDVVRSPPNVDLRYRSPDLPLAPNYFNRQDDRYVTSPTVSISDNSLYYDREGRYDVPSTYSYRQPPNYGSYSGYPSRYDYTRNLYRVGPNLVRRTVSPEDYRTSSRSSPTAANANNRNNEKTRGSDNNGERVAPYPVKISTGVNVKENDRKVPERRVYADREREYVYAPPSFQTADDDSVGFESRY